MRRRGQQFDTGRGAGRTLAQVLRVYAGAAYPQQGSECSQASRSALLQLAEQIASASGEAVVLQKRQLPLIRSAVSWYFTEVQRDMDQVRDALLERLQ